MDVAGLYPNILHEEGLSVLRKRLKTRKEKYVSTDTITDLAEVVLKNNIFPFGKKTLKQKFTAEWSKTSIIVLDITVSLIEGVIETDTDLYVKPKDSHQYLQSSSCHSFHCKKSIPYSQVLRLNRICSETNSFHKRCNDLERFLSERGYSFKLVRKEVLWVRKIPRN